MPRITDDMKKIRDVSPRFLENKRKMVSRYREYGIEDGDVWTSSTGEGLAYQDLLKMPFYEDCHKLPENVVIKKGRYVANEKLLNWDEYFSALQKNFQVGITSKAKVSKQIKEKGLKQSQSNVTADDLYGGKIEWDDIQQPSEADKDNSALKQKYKVQLKQITENEKEEILKEIEKDELSQAPNPSKYSQSSAEKSQNIANFLKSAVIVPNESSEEKEFKIFSVEEIENELVSIDPSFRQLETEETNRTELFGFFDDEAGAGENQLAISKENKEGNNCAEDELVEFDNIDAYQLKNLDNTNKSVLTSLPIQPDIHQESEELYDKNSEENKKLEQEMKIISADDLDKIQSRSVMQQNKIEQPNNQMQIEEQMSFTQNTVTSTKQNSEVNNTKYEVNQEEMEQQHLIDQLNQEGIKTAIMKNAKLMNQYQKSQSSKSFMHYTTTPDPETNPFESFLQSGYNSNSFFILNFS